MAEYRKIPATGDVDLDRINQAVYEALLKISPPPAFQAITVSKDYAARGDEGVIHVDSSAGAVRVTLPKPSAALPPLVVKQVNASKSPRATFGPVTVVAADAAKTIAGASSFPLDVSGTGSVTFTSDGQQHWPGAAAGGNPSVPPAAPPAPPYVPPPSASYVPLTRMINTIPPLLGGGSLASDLTLSLTIDGTLDASTGALGRAAITGDVVISLGSNTATLVNIPNDTAAAGDILFTVRSGPFPAGTGRGRVWFDSTDKVPKGIDDIGRVTHMVQTRGALTSQFLISIANDGTVASAQPAFTDISGTVAPAQLGSFTNGSVLFWNSGLAQDNANFSYDSTAHTLTLLGGSPIALGAGAQAITKTSGTLNFVTTGSGAFVFSPNSTQTMELTTSGAVRIDSLNAGGMTKAAVTTGQLAIATPGTDYQAPVTWPTASQVLVSAGVAVNPLGDPTFTFDRVAHVMAGGNSIGINGVSVPSNVSLCVGHTTAADRDRVQYFVGGGTLGPTGSGDSTFVDINPTSTSLNSKAVAAPAIYATARIRQVTYTGGLLTDAVGQAASLYIDASPTLQFVGGPSYAVYVAAGTSFFGGDVNLATGRAMSAPTLSANGVSNAFYASGTGAGAAVGVFGAGGGFGVVQQTGGAASAGAAYTAVEQGMINRMYSALRTYGWLT